MLTVLKDITITDEEIRRDLAKILKNEFFTLVTGDSLAVEKIEEKGGALSITMEDGAKFILTVKKVA